jgi:hypothetical protein
MLSHVTQLLAYATASKCRKTPVGSGGRRKASLSEKYWYVPHTEICECTQRVRRFGLRSSPLDTVSDLLILALATLTPSARVKSKHCSPTFKKGDSYSFSENILTITTSILIPIVASFKELPREKKLRNLVRSVQHIVDVLSDLEDPMAVEQAFVKYHHTLLKQKLFRDSEPSPSPPPEKRLLYKGYLKHYLSLALSTRRRSQDRTMSLILSLYESKDKWPQLGDLPLKAAFEKHKKALTTPGITSPELITAVTCTARKIFRDWRPPTKFLPTGHGCMEASRQCLGTRSLVEPLVISNFDKIPLKPLDPAEAGFAQAVKARTERTLLEPIEAWKQEWYENEVDRVRVQFAEHSPDLYKTQVVAIPEASKFRMITKMNGHLANALQPQQGQLIANWKLDPSNTMNQEPEFLVNRLIQETQGVPGMEVFVSGDYAAATDTLHRDASVAALNGALPSLVDPDIAALSLLPATLRYPMMDEAGKVMTQEIPPPPGAKRGVRVIMFESVQQENGQLMGHDLSFPLLCCINKACFLHALKKWFRAECDLIALAPQGKLILSLFSHRSKPSHDKVLAGHVLEWRRIRAYQRRPVNKVLIDWLRWAQLVKSTMERTVIINGDDILFRCPRSFYPFWVDSVQDVGFVLSVGKNYVSEDTCQINSQVFTISGGKVVRHGYLNQKLLFGENPDMDGPDKNLMWDPRTHSNRELTPLTLGRHLNQMWSICPIGKALLPDALRRWEGDAAALSRISGYRPNWFIPVHLGGYGLDQSLVSNGNFNGISREQRRVAQWFYENPREALYRQLGAPTPTVSRVFEDRKAKWFFGPDDEDRQEWLEDDWFVRGTLIEEATRLHVPPQVTRISLNRSYCKPRTGRAMSFRMLRELWHVMPRNSGIPPCPPLRPIRGYNKNSFSELKGWSSGHQPFGFDVEVMSRQWSLAQ